MAATAQKRQRSLRILFVEDSAADVELCLRELKRAGLRVEARMASTPEQFLERIRAGDLDLILCDYNLQSWTGLDALESMRREGKALPFILVSGSVGEERAVDLVLKGASDFILKDRMVRLPLAVRRALEEKALRDQQQETQRRLEERTAFLTALIENSPLAILVLDPQRRVRMCNRAFERLFGHCQAEIEGLSVEELFGSPGGTEDLDPVVEQIGGERMVHAVTQRRRRDGAPLDVELHAVPLVVAGKILGYFGIYQDISDRKRAEQERLHALKLQAENEALARADRLKSEFLADMSHEFRTPLNSILGFSELLLETCQQLTPKQQEDLRIIHREGHRLLGLVNDLLDLARIEAGQLPLEPTLVPVRETLLRVVDSVSGAFREKKLSQRVDVEPADLAVWADPRRFDQILTNLLSNALKFTREGGITLRARPASDAVCVEVIDTGVGIPAAALPHVFDKFYQVHRQAEGAAKGTGLGLAITRQLVELQGGTIGVESAEGEGSRFFFTLPRVAGAGDSVGEEGARVANADRVGD
ncbi:MAG TPA: ATP-binding protein [Candidatus Xenobia bacterium]|nr:ATP-binding protein [Candidatus Xenobia bacterium]